MGIAEGRAYFRELGLEDRVQEFTVSSATVELAAAALGVEGARIAKTLSFQREMRGLITTNLRRSSTSRPKCCLRKRCWKWSDTP